MKLQPFTYAVMLHPTQEGIKAGEMTRWVIKPTDILATDLQSVNLTAARQIPTDLAGPDSLSRIEVVVRPF